MRVFRRRKKFGNFGGSPEDAAPIPDVVYQMGAEVAAQYAAARSQPQNPYNGYNPLGQEPFYESPYAQIPIGSDPIYAVPGNEIGGEVRSSSPLQFLASKLGFHRSGSRERYANRAMDNFVRPGSPMLFNQRPPGTPVKYRRRPASPELAQGRVPSPLHFAQQPRASSPDIARRLQRAQLSQELQQMEKQQRRQQEMYMNQMSSMSPYDQIQQQQQGYYPMMNPNYNYQAYSTPQQPLMYPYY